MRGRILATEALAVLAALVIVEAGEVIRELRTDVVTDWFVSLVPLVWIDVSILVLYLFVRLARNPGLAAASRRPGTPSVWSRLLPDLRVVPTRDPRFRRAWMAASLAYGLAYAFLQGILVVDLSGTIDPGFAVIDSPIGYGPALVWAPSNTVGVVLRPYSLAAASVLAVLSGLVIVLSLRFAASRRRAAGALSSPLVGFAVMCPACVGAPVSGLFLAYAAPLSAMGMLGASSAFSRMLLVSTLMLLGTLALLWIVIALFTNLLLREGSASSARESPQGSA